MTIHEDILEAMLNDYTKRLKHGELTPVELLEFHQTSNALWNKKFDGLLQEFQKLAKQLDEEIMIARTFAITHNLVEEFKVFRDAMTIHRKLKKQGKDD